MPRAKKPLPDDSPGSEGFTGALRRASRGSSGGGGIVGLHHRTLSSRTITIMGYVPARPSLERSSSSSDGEELDQLFLRDSIDLPGLPTHHARRERERERNGSGPPRWTKRIPSRYFGLCRNLASLVLIAYAAVCVLLFYWILRFLLLRHTAYSHSIFAPPLVPNPHPVEHDVPRVALSSNASLPLLQAELDHRLASLSLPASTLRCDWTLFDETKYSPLRDHGPYLFAINLWNNEVVFPTLARTLLAVSDFLGRDNVAISIFENGSTDNTTTAMAHFAATLSAAGVAHTITSDPRRTDWKRVDRIAQLAVYRNLALLPLNTTTTLVKPFETVVFINDVFACPRDPLELLFQKRHQGADAACAMDWRATHSWFSYIGFQSVKYYDNCELLLPDSDLKKVAHVLNLNNDFAGVGRTITGDMFRSRFDILTETRDGIAELFDQPGSEFSRSRWLAVLPVPVYSCWNGMVAMTAAPFRGDTRPAISFRSALANEDECSASECKTVARDFWVQGLRKWMIVPSVHVTYAQKVYTHPALVGLQTPSVPAPGAPPELIDWDELSPPESVVCYEWVRGFHVDLPYRRTRQPPFRR